MINHLNRADNIAIPLIVINHIIRNSQLGIFFLDLELLLQHPI